jgi:hypothetical protein
MRAVSDQGDSTERLRRGADESAAHQAELRARAERVIHRGDFNEQVRRGPTRPPSAPSCARGPG